MSSDRFFDPDPQQRGLARQLYSAVAGAPLVCPHGHVDPRILADPGYSFGTPTALLILPDHYILRTLHSQGIRLEALGIPERGHARDGGQQQPDDRQIWQLFAEHFYLFRGTPTGSWLEAELRELFGVESKLTAGTAHAIYDQISACLQQPGFRPRALYERFNIRVLCTTDAATDTLEHHRRIRESSWGGRVLPTFRPDRLVGIDASGWREQVDLLGDVSGIEVTDYRTFIAALEQRREFFREMGATATDHAVVTPYTEALAPGEIEAIFQRALGGAASTDDAGRFTAHMLMEFARMSCEDGLVMQLHAGAFRNHNQELYERFGPDVGGDIPVRVEFTRNLRPLLNRFGNEQGFRLILFTLDETTYGRELAPLAGHYPAVKVGPPWWFFDSLNGMRRYFDRVIETAGLYNTAGFNDDTRAFASIGARHDLWRRASVNWLAGLVVRGVVDEEDAAEMALDLACRLALGAYNLEAG
jgi:glucuronate isomerase